MNKIKKMLSIESIENIIKKLPHSEGRVPYTYHHDYLRTRVKKYSGMSRAEIALYHDSSEIELFSVSLVYLLDELGSEVFSYIYQDDLLIINEAIMVTKNLLLKLK